MEKLQYYLAKVLRIIIHRPALRNCKIDKSSKICSGTQMNSVTMSRFSYIGHDCFVNSTSIGSFCSIADGCKIGGAQHPIQYVSSSPVFHEGKNILGINFSNHQDPSDKITIIEADVWIGMGCIIKGGIKVGTGAVIGAGSVVTKDIPPYEIWAGNPARLIRNRFREEVAKELLASEWWKMPIQEIADYSQYFYDPEVFLAKYHENRKNGV